MGEVSSQIISRTNDCRQMHDPSDQGQVKAGQNRVLLDNDYIQYSYSKSR